METWQQTNVVLPDGNSVVQVNICASPSEFDTVAKRTNDLLYATIVPLSGKTHKGPVSVGAEFSLSWKASDGVSQEVKYETSHIFSGKNPAEWRLRLDGYIPLLQSTETYKPPAKKSRGSSVRKQQNKSVVKPTMISDSVIGVITISLWKENGKNVNNDTSPYRIESGRVKVEGKVLRVSKELLAVHSQYFSTLFYGNFKEKDMKVISLPDLSRSALSSILHMISSPGSTPQSVDAACKLLNIANRCEVLGVIMKCSKYLQSVKLNEKDASILLKSADECGQPDLLKHALASFTSPSSLKDAFCPVVTTTSPETAVAVVTHISDMVTMRGNSTMNQLKVFLTDPISGNKLCFELFYDQIPVIAWSFVLLFTPDINHRSNNPISLDRPSWSFTVDSEWREEIEGTTPRKGKGYMLYTNSTYSFEITNENRTTGHFFGKLVEGAISYPYGGRYGLNPHTFGCYT